MLFKFFVFDFVLLYLYILEKTRWKRLYDSFKLSKKLALLRHLATKKPLHWSGGEPQAYRLYLGALKGR